MTKDNGDRLFVEITAKWLAAEIDYSENNGCGVPLPTLRLGVQIMIDSCFAHHCVIYEDKQELFEVHSVLESISL